MLGLLIILLLSGFISFWYEGKITAFLGLTPFQSKWKLFIIGLLFALIVQLAFILIEGLVLKTTWHLNSGINWQIILNAVYYHLRSALTEDLIFRGVLLYLLIDKIGMRKAAMISASLFGIYHWFSYDMFSMGLIPLIYVFLSTAYMGYVWSLAYGKTKSILIGLGFHTMWNIVFAFAMDAQPFGELLFEIQITAAPESTAYTIFTVGKGFIPPAIFHLALNKWIVKTVKID